MLYLVFIVLISTVLVVLSKPPIHKAKNGANLNFLFFGDWGVAGENQTIIAESMGSWAQDNNSSFVIALGDNFYCKFLTLSYVANLNC